MSDSKSLFKFLNFIGWRKFLFIWERQAFALDKAAKCLRSGRLLLFLYELLNLNRP